MSNINLRKKITAEELAKIFYHSDSKYQARFFNEIYNIYINKGDDYFSSKCENISNEKVLSGGARFIMGQIGDCCKK